MGNQESKGKGAVMFQGERLSLDLVHLVLERHPSTLTQTLTLDVLKEIALVRLPSKPSPFIEQ